MGTIYDRKLSDSKCSLVVQQVKYLAFSLLWLGSNVVQVRSLALELPLAVGMVETGSSHDETIRFNESSRT